MSPVFCNLPARPPVQPCLSARAVLQWVPVSKCPPCPSAGPTPPCKPSATLTATVFATFSGFGTALRKLNTTEILITQAGTYEVSYLLNVTAGGTAARVFSSGAFIQSTVDIPANAKGFLSASGLYSANVGDVLSLAVQSTQAATVERGYFNLTLVSGQTLAPL